MAVKKAMKPMRKQFKFLMDSSFFVFVILVSLYSLSFEVRAQDKESPIGGSHGLNLRFTPNGDLNATSKVMLTILRRVHKLGIESYFSEMQKDGVSSRTFGLSAEGALLYNYEIGIRSGVISGPEVIKGVEDMDPTGRGAGGQVLPYDIKLVLGPDGQKRISVSAFAFREMNDFERAYGGVRDDSWFSDPDSGGPWAYINKLELVTFTWDQNYSFNNLRTFDFKIFQIEAKLPLSSGPRYVLSLAGSMNMGGIQTEYTLDDGSKVDVVRPHQDGDLINIEGYTPVSFYQPHKATQFQWNYTSGLEYKQKFKNGDILGLQTNWRAGIHRAWFNDPDIVNNNIKIKNQFEADKAQFPVVEGQYTIDRNNYDYAKLKYAQDHQVPVETVSDAYFDAQQSQYKAPVKPSKPVEPLYLSNITDANRRNYGYLTTSFSYSKLLNSKKTESAYLTEPGAKQKRPLRLGFEVEWNLYIKDGFKSAPASMTYDYNKNNRRMMTGKIYLKF